MKILLIYLIIVHSCISVISRITKYNYRNYTNNKVEINELACESLLVKTETIGRLKIEN